LEQQQVVELALRDAAEPGSVTRTDSVLRLAARRVPRTAAVCRALMYLTVPPASQEAMLDCM